MGNSSKLHQIAAVPAAQDLDQSHSRKWTLLIGLMLVLMAAAVRIPSLTARGYLMDEAWTAELASGRGSAHLHLPKDAVLPMPDFFSFSGENAVPWWRIWGRMECTHPPLYFIGLRLWASVFGGGDAAERSFSILASLIAVGLLYDVARLCNGRSVGIWACILMALAQPQIQYARETRNYAWLIVCALVAADALVRMEKLGPSRRRWAALTIGVLATLLTHYFGIGMLIGLGLYAVMRTRGRVRAQIVGAFVLAVIVFALCWGPFMWQQRSLASTSDQTTNFLLDKPAGHLGWTFWRLALVPGVLLAEPRGAAIYVCACGALLYILPLIVLRRRSDLLMWILWMLGVIGVVAALDFTRDTHHLGLIRYTLLAGPAVYVLIPGLACGLKRLAWLRHGVPAIAALYCLWALPDAYRSPITDPQIIAKELQSAAGSQDLLLFIGTGKNEWWAGGQCLLFSRYLGPTPCPIAVLSGPAGDDVTHRAAASGRIFAFTLGENPADYIRGIFPQGVTKFRGQGCLWVALRESSRSVDQ